MLWLIDTNILVSAALFPQSVPAQSYMRAVSPPHHAVICDYSLNEMRRVYIRKFPEKIPAFERFISILSISVGIVPAPEKAIPESVKGEDKIRDLNDRPIFRAAVAANVDGIITGDKDFLDAGIKIPQVLSPAEFIKAYP